jgi:hypothetical protein
MTMHGNMLRGNKNMYFFALNQEPGQFPIPVRDQSPATLHINYHIGAGPEGLIHEEMNAHGKIILIHYPKNGNSCAQIPFHDY